VLVEERIFEDFSKSAKSVSLQTFRTDRSSVWTPVTESQCLIPVQTAQRTWTIESFYLQRVWTAQLMRTTKSTCLQGCPNAKVKTLDGEAFPCNLSDARSSHLNALSQNLKLLFPVWMPPHRNPFLTCFRISRAYLKGLLGSFFGRVREWNSILLREGI
jgi:hypothetical protein